MTDPAIRIVSLTVTEGGYFVDPATGALRSDGTPRSWRMRRTPIAPPRPLARSSRRCRLRRAAGVAALHRHVLRQPAGQRPCHAGCRRGACRALRPGAWPTGSRANVAFPNGMVDRITPATGPRERALAASFGLDDPVPVTCEPFRQWVLEDDFPAGPPGAGAGRRHLHAACPRLRGDEDPHPERRACDHRLSRRADGHRTGARGDGPSADLGLSGQGRDAKRSSPLSRPCRTPTLAPISS